MHCSCLFYTMKLTSSNYYFVLGCLLRVYISWIWSYLGHYGWFLKFKKSPVGVMCQHFSAKRNTLHGILKREHALGALYLQHNWIIALVAVILWNPSPVIHFIFVELMISFYIATLLHRIVNQTTILQKICPIRMHCDSIVSVILSLLVC
jgi:hypothetical protein